MQIGQAGAQAKDMAGQAGDAAQDAAKQAQDAAKDIKPAADDIADQELQAAKQVRLCLISDVALHNHSWLVVGSSASTLGLINARTSHSFTQTPSVHMAQIFPQQCSPV